MGNTTKIILIDNTNDNYLVFSNKGVLASYLHTSRENVVNWFREGVKVVKVDTYILYKVDKYYNRVSL